MNRHDVLQIKVLSFEIRFEGPNKDAGHCTLVHCAYIIKQSQPTANEQLSTRSGNCLLFLTKSRALIVNKKSIIHIWLEVTIRE